MLPTGLLLSSALCVSALAVDLVPAAKGMEPRSGPPGTVVTITGHTLDKSRVEEIYLTDHRFDLLVKVLDQLEDRITIRVPPFAKPGRYQILFLARNTSQQQVLLEQPVYLLVEEGPPAPAPPEPKLQTKAPSPGAPAPTMASAAPAGQPPSPAAAHEVDPTATTVETILTPVQIVKQQAPMYPPIARQMKLFGAVTLSITVDSDGNVSNVDVVDGNPILAAGAISAVKKWDYKPATIRGVPVKSTTAVTIRFGNP